MTNENPTQNFSQSEVEYNNIVNFLNKLVIVSYDTVFGFMVGGLAGALLGIAEPRLAPVLIVTGAVIGLPVGARIGVAQIVKEQDSQKK